MMIDRSFSTEEVLRDGSRVTVRAIRPEDSTGLREGFGRLSAVSRYRRFLSSQTELSPSALDYLTRVDFQDHAALVAYGRIREGQPVTGLGVARFIRLADEPEVAEAAVTVIDAVQGRGLGKVLLRLLTQAAIERGIRVFRAEILRDNLPVQQILHSVGARLCDTHGPIQVVEVDLPPPSGA